jgi:ABC-type polysaccharide/polyol phosphate transport system ATPase subunit
MKDDVLIRVKGVSKKFSKSLSRSMRYGLRDLVSELLPGGSRRDTLRADEFWAVQDVSFEVKRGQSLALIGPNGAGKSTLLRMLMGRPKLTQGRIEIHAHLAAITELGAGFNPKQTGLENIYNSSAVLGMPRSKIRGLVDTIVDFAGLSEFLEMPVQNYSTGMRARLGFAIAIHLQPEVLLIDEALAVGDLGFKRKCMRRLLQYVDQGGSLIAVAHDMYSLQQLCNQSLLLHRGRVLFQGPIIPGIERCFELFQTLEQDRLPEHSQTESCLSQRKPGVQGPAAEDSSVQPLFDVNKRDDLCFDNPIHIDSVSLQPLDGTAVRSNHPVRVDVDYRSLITLDTGFVWGFTLLTADQLIRIASGIRLEENPEYRIVRGSGRLSCVIPRLPLCAGRYGISAAIVESDTRRSIARIGYDEPAPVFQVVAESGALNNIRAMRGELVLLDVLWAGDSGSLDL